MKKMLTEELPSSGSQPCNHEWQRAGDADATHYLMVCRKESCGKSKLVDKPKMQESKAEKTLLCG